MKHAHIYFEERSREIVEKIRLNLLSSPWCLFVGSVSDKLLGPHPMPQLEIHFHDEELMKAVKFLLLNKENLSVLVHTVTQNDYLDHTENCFWLGTELNLDFSKLDKLGENKAIQRFSVEEVTQ